MGIMTGALVAGVAGSAISSSAQRGAAKDASAAQTSAANAQIAAQQKALAESRQLLSPYVNAGNSALMAQMDLLGLDYSVPTQSQQPIQTQQQTQQQSQSPLMTRMNTGTSFLNGTYTGFMGSGGLANRVNMMNNSKLVGPQPTAGQYATQPTAGTQLSGADRQAAAIAQLENSPMFQALVQQGEDAMLQNAAATGGVRGGNMQGALAQYRPQMLNQQIQQRMQYLGGLSSMGQNAAAGVGNAGFSAADSISNAYGQIGSAQAGSALASGQATANLAGGIGGTIGQLGMMQALGMFGGGTQGGSFGSVLGAF